MRWRPAIPAGVAVLLAGAASAAEVSGFERWRLGMTREEVLAISSAGPYSPVAATGGLETANARFAGRRVTASFVFGTAGLRHVQVWVYEGEVYRDALQAFHEAYSYLSESFGLLRSDAGQLPAGLTLQGLDRLVPAEFRTGTSRSEVEELQVTRSIQAQILKLHLHPRQPPVGAEVYASLIHSPQIGAYWVFVHFKRVEDAGLAIGQRPEGQR